MQIDQLVKRTERIELVCDIISNHHLLRFFRKMILIKLLSYYKTIIKVAYTRICKRKCMNKNNHEKILKAAIFCMAKDAECLRLWSSMLLAMIHIVFSSKPTTKVIVPCMETLTIKKSTAWHSPRLDVKLKNICVRLYSSKLLYSL